jgi:hypothetical protein
MKQVILALVVVVLILGYDETTAAGVTPPEKAVAERVVQRWAALIGQDFNRAYEFETPGFRETNPIGRYRGFYGNAVKWENAEVGNVHLSADRQSAKVSVILDYEGPKPGGGVYQGQRSVMEAWLWMDGNWWYVRNMKGLR